MERVTDENYLPRQGVGNIRALYFKQDGVELIKIVGFKSVGEPWNIHISGGGYHNDYIFQFYQRWKTDDVFDRVLLYIERKDKAKAAIFNRIFSGAV